MSPKNNKTSQFWNLDDGGINLNLNGTKLFLYSNIQLDFQFQDVWKKDEKGKFVNLILKLNI